MDEQEPKKHRSYLIKASKWIRHEGKGYQVPAMLSIFVDEDGNVKHIREV